MKINLSIVWDQYGYDKADLYTTETLEEMDKYLLNFNNHKEIRELYQKDIQEFLMDNRTMRIQNERKNPNNKKEEQTSIKNEDIDKGRICITFYGKKNIARMVPIMYKKGKKMLNTNVCLSKIKKSLENDDILKELYIRKRYLLSQYEIDLLRDYFLFPHSYKKYKHIMIDYFINKLKTYNSNRLYLYLRSLMNVCDLWEKRKINTKYGIIDNIDYNLPINTKVNKTQIYDECIDDYFIRLIEENNYEELYNVYNIETIDKYSDHYKRSK